MTVQRSFEPGPGHEARRIPLLLACLEYVAWDTEQVEKPGNIQRDSSRSSVIEFGLAINGYYLLH